MSTDPSLPRIHLPKLLADAVDTEITAWQTSAKVERIWKRDSGVWTGSDEEKWLGWLDSPEKTLRDLSALKNLRDDAKSFSHVLVFGMGGSSLGPEVLGRTLHARLHTIDSTDPAQVLAVESAHDPEKTLYINSSKSGGTLETRILGQYFLARAKLKLGDKAGSHFIAVTDPGSALEKTAREEGFRHIFLGEPSIGGRYSVLSPFGLVPAAAADIDIEEILQSASKMAKACREPGADNPGLLMGAILGVATRQGRDKVTISTSPGISLLGAWIEQIIAESTGKQGKGIIPIDGEKLDAPQTYGDDRLFIDIAIDGDLTRNPLLDALEKAGQPVIRLIMHDTGALGGEFFRWAFATAVAGAVIGINPFDQPDVEAAKIKTRAVMEKGGMAKAQPATMISSELIRDFLSDMKARDYAALLAYVAQSERNAAPLERARLLIRDKKHCATSLGFGPRFQHSTGQLFKGGPASGHFIFFTADPVVELPVPGEGYSFGSVIRAQAEGDMEVLRERGRKLLHIHLGSDIEGNLAKFIEAVKGT